MKRHLIYTIFTLLIVLIIFPQTTIAKSKGEGLKIGVKIPHSYDISYYNRHSVRISYHLGGQFITIPFSSSPINWMNQWGADPEITDILSEPFMLGAGLDAGCQYYFGKDNRRYYASISINWMNLLKRDISDKVIDNAFDIVLANYPEGPIHRWQSTKPLTLNSNYINMGFYMGKVFFFNRRKAELRIELGFSKTIFSHHHLQSDYRYISPITEETNDALKSTMKKYGWYPTVNLYYIVKYPR